RIPYQTVPAMTKFLHCNSNRPTRARLSKPVQRIMLINEFVIAVVFQKICALLQDDGGNQAIHGIPNRYPFAPQFAVDRRAQFKRRPVVFKINQIFKLSFDGDKLLFVANALQYLGQHKTAAANVIAVPDTLLQLSGLVGFSSSKKINPDGRINEQSHGIRLWRMASRFPCQRTLPLSDNEPVCFSRRTNS